MLRAEGLDGLHVDNHLELRGLLHREIGGLGALEDFVDVHRSALGDLRQARCVGQHSTCHSAFSRLR